MKWDGMKFHHTTHNSNAENFKSIQEKDDQRLKNGTSKERLKELKLLYLKKV
jgi:hypothetical protein